MRPILFHIGNYAVFSTTIMLFIAFMAGILVVRWQFIKNSIPTTKLYPFAALIVVSCLIGARFFYVLSNMDQYSGQWGNAFDLNGSGMVFYGGLLFAAIVGIVAVRLMKLPAGVIAGASGLALPLFLALARVGCFLNGCCGGKPSGLPWAVTFSGSVEAVHPTQLYEVILDMGIFIVLLIIVRRWGTDWDLFFLSIALYAAGRLVVDFFRYYPTLGQQVLFQILSATILVAAVSVLIYRRRKRFRLSPESAQEN